VISDPLEAEIQIQLVQYLALAAPSRGFLFWSTPNEGMGNARGGGGIGRMLKLKRMGLRSGVADLVIVKNGSVYFLGSCHRQEWQRLLSGAEAAPWQAVGESACL